MSEQQQNNADINVISLFPPKSDVKTDEADQRQFARQLLIGFWLIGLAIICIDIFIACGWYPHNAAPVAMFTLARTGALPLVTLGYLPSIFSTPTQWSANQLGQAVAPRQSGAPKS